MTHIKTEQDKTSPEARAYRLKMVRAMTMKSRREIEEKYHIKESSIKSWEMARFSGLSRKGAIRVVDMLIQEGVFCTIEWLLFGIGATPHLIIKEPSGTDAPKTVTTSCDEVISELRLFYQHHKNAVDFIIPDGSMLPRFAIGEHVAGIPRQGDIIERFIGHECIVQTKDGETLVRRIMKGEKVGHYNLVCLNQNTNIKRPIIYEAQLLSAAPIIWQRRIDPILNTRPPSAQ